MLLPPLNKGCGLLNSLIYANFTWNWPNGSGVNSKMFSMYIRYYLYHSLSFEQTWIPFTQGCSVSKLAEIAWVGICIFAIVSIWKKKPHGMNYFHIRRFCDKFGWNWLSDSWEEDENVKSLQARTDRQTTDNMQSERLTITFSSGELNNLAKYTPIK